MGSLIHQISALSAARYGINILELRPPSSVRGAGSSIVAAFGHFPWGPVDIATEIGTVGELLQTFCPEPFDIADDYDAMKAFVNKSFPNILKIVRISPSGQATATKTFDDATPGGQQSVKVDANYPGVAGNSISIAWSANADDATARDATVSIGTAYSVTYKQVATIVAAALVVTDPGDPYVTFSPASGTPTLVPAAIAATALTGGADGTPAAGDYTAAIDLFADPSLDWNVLFGAEVESSLRDEVNTHLKSFMDSEKRGFAVLCTIPAESSSAAKTTAASHRSDRLAYLWPEVKTINPFDDDRPEITVDGNAFAAAAIANVEPHVSPGGAPGAAWLQGITGVTLTASASTLNDLNKNGGVIPWFISTALGPILHKGITTSLTTGLTQIYRRRKTDHLMTSMASFLEQFVGQPLDIDITRQILGEFTASEVAGLKQFLEEEKLRGRIADWSLDPFSGNTSVNIANNQWIILVAVRLVSSQDEIILKASVGEAVEIVEN